MKDPTPEQFHVQKLRALEEHPQYDSDAWLRSYFAELRWLLDFWHKENK